MKKIIMNKLDAFDVEVDILVKVVSRFGKEEVFDENEKRKIGSQLSEINRRIRKLELQLGVGDVAQW